MKIVLLGGHGLLGSYFANAIDVSVYDKENLDITDSEKIHEVFAAEKPDMVINCAAYTAVDDAEKNRDLAFKINSEAAGNVARACKEFDAVLVHFSTDYVFDGTKKEGYREDDLPTPINVYGESKLIGEREILASGCKHYLVRTSWLFGKYGKNFVDTMIELGKKQSEVKVVNDQFGCPTYAKDLAEAVVENFIKNKPQFGIYHLTNFGQTSWYEFAKEIFKVARMDVKVVPISTSEFPRPAKRPNFSTLLNTKLPELRFWQEAIKDYCS